MTPDPRRWITLSLVIMSAFIVVLDNTVLNVAIPTILRDLHTNLAAVQWVISGYSLTFASLLIIGGRLGDLYGSRRMFIIGAAIFGVGSFIASISTGIPEMIVGEAIIEGIGASLMLPATLSIISTTFDGHERATAFAAWGAVIGAGAAFGPVLGGYLTTYHSWRWAFRLNVIVAPIVMLGVLLFMRQEAPARARSRLDVPGALFVAVGMFSLVFGITQSNTYGWFRSLHDFSVVGHVVWSKSHHLSIVPIAFVLAAVMLVAFVRLELRLERGTGQPLFELGQFRNKSFRYGVLVAFLLSMGQFGMMFVVPVFLQDAKHLSALDNGLWMCPMGVAMLVSAQLGGRLTRAIGTVALVRIGLLIDVVGIVGEAFLLRPTVTFWQLLPIVVLYGFGSGFVSSQLTNVVLFAVDPEHAGAASGANSTARQTGSALGIAVIGAVFTAVIARHGLAAAVKPAMLTGAAILAVAAAVSFLLPNVDQHTYSAAEEGVDLYDVLEPVDSHLTG